MIARSLAVAAALAASGCASVPDPNPGLDRVIARNLEAMGGGRALDGLRNLRLRLEWTEGGRAFAGDWRATRAGLMRIDVFIDGKRVFSEGLDARGAWEQPGEGAKVADVGAEPRQALQHGVDYRFFNIWRARERGNQVSLEGRETVGGTDYHVVRLRFADGFETYFYINAATWLTERKRDTRAYHPSSDPKKILVETVHDEFTELCGFKVPSRLHDADLKAGATITVNRLVEGRCNLPLEALDIGRPL